MIREQIVRYAVIGLLLNAALYGTYLWLRMLVVHSGIRHQGMMTVTLPIMLFTLQRYSVFPDHSSRREILLVSSIL